ncbi:MAG: YraN family protein [Bacteroidetes bacterium]|nr:YraN family protein [Bacteroidota bacterium]
MNKVLGAKGEQLAAEFMSRRGYEVVEKNFKYDRGEIDIIARKGNLIVFCEVKTRTNNAYGGGENAVDSRKQEQIRKVAEGYIAERNLSAGSLGEDFDFRFDVIVVEMSSSSTKIRVIENAF